MGSTHGISPCFLKKITQVLTTILYHRINKLLKICDVRDVLTSQKMRTANEGFDG